MTLNKKAIFPLLILVFSIIYLIEAIKLGHPITAEGVRPSFVPIVLGSLASIFSLIMSIQAFRMPRTVDSAAQAPAAGDESEESDSSITPAILTIVAISIYIALFQALGYLISSLIFVFAITTIFSDSGKWLSKLVTSAAIVAFGYIVFEQLFGVRLPTLWG